MKKKLLSIIGGCLLPMALLAGSGDVNGDGVVDTTDIKAIISHIMGEQPKNFNKEEADVNGDGNVNIADVVIIQSQTDKKNLTSKLHLEIAMPQAGDYKAVILETDGRLHTQTKSAIQVLPLDGVQLSDDNLVLDACLEMPDAYVDYPFDDTNYTCMRHGSNKKIFALIFEYDGHIWINVKNDPAWGDFWRSEFASIVPAYHMNKLHWSGIILDGSVDDDVIHRLITDSYDLTAPRMKKKYTEEF